MLNGKANNGEQLSDLSSDSRKSSSPEKRKQVASTKSSGKGGALAMTHVANDDEALTLLRSWQKDEAFGGHERVSDLSRALCQKWLQTPDLPDHGHLTGVISGVLA